MGIAFILFNSIAKREYFKKTFDDLKDEMKV